MIGAVSEWYFWIRVWTAAIVSSLRWTRRGAMSGGGGLYFFGAVAAARKLSDFDTLKTIYPLYPGLKYEIERLQQRREQHDQRLR